MGPRGGEWDWHWARAEWGSVAATKAAEALAEANATSKQNFLSLEARLMTLEEEVDARDACYKRKLEKLENQIDGYSRLQDERLRQLEQHSNGRQSNIMRQQLEQLLSNHQGLLEKHQELLESHKILGDKIQTLEDKFSDAQPQAAAAPATVTFGAAPHGPLTSQIQAPQLPSTSTSADGSMTFYGTSRADANPAPPQPPQHAPPDANPAPPQHAPPRQAEQPPPPMVASGLISDTWMPEHRHFRPLARPWQAPPRPRRCQHVQSQWFTNYFDPNSKKSKAYFVSRRDVGYDIWANKLQKACASVQTCFEFPYDNTLFTTMMDRPDLLFQWHNAHCGGFYFLHWLCQLQFMHGALPAPVSNGFGGLQPRSGALQGQSTEGA